MSANSVIDEIRDSLNGRPGQPIVFGVCRALADKFNKEPWVFRLAALVLTLFWTLPAIAAYIILGFALNDTEDRTRRFFSGLAIIIREGVDKLSESLRDMFGPERV
ncbi:MAG: PspC domain-containing protein [Gammaproteobacteria bacterium]|jgi:phage shock protein PspC (stress-responsive transcriptional regulator)|nr:PspC domain-containing protein [Gammaproteobacteria bacterium]